MRTKSDVQAENQDASSDAKDRVRAINKANRARNLEAKIAKLRRLLKEAEEQLAAI